MYIPASGTVHSGQVASSSDSSKLSQVTQMAHQMPFKCHDLTTALFPSEVAAGAADLHLCQGANGRSKLFMLRSGDNVGAELFALGNAKFKHRELESVEQLTVAKLDAPSPQDIKTLCDALKRGTVTVGSNRPAMLALIPAMIEQRLFAENAAKNSGKVLGADTLKLVPKLTNLSPAQSGVLDAHAVALEAEMTKALQEKDRSPAPSPRSSREDVRAKDDEDLYVNFPGKADPPSLPRRQAPVARELAQRPNAAMTTFGGQPGSPTFPEPSQRSGSGRSSGTSRSMEDLTKLASPRSPLISRAPRQFAARTEPVAHGAHVSPTLQLSVPLAQIGKGLADAFVESHGKGGLFSRKAKGTTGAEGSVSELVKELATNRDKLKTLILDMRDRSELPADDFHDALAAAFRETVAFTAHRAKDHGPLKRHVRSEHFTNAADAAGSTQRASSEAMKGVSDPAQRKALWAEAMADRVALAVFEALESIGSK